MRHALLLVAALAVALGGCYEDDTVKDDVCLPAQPTMVRFNDQGALETESLNLDGLTVSGSSDLNLLSMNGLGVEGGMSDRVIDGTEWTRFDVNAGAALDVSYNVTRVEDGDHDDRDGEATIEAFDRSGASLGLVAVDSAGVHDV